MILLRINCSPLTAKEQSTLQRFANQPIDKNNMIKVTVLHLPLTPLAIITEADKYGLSPDDLIEIPSSDLRRSFKTDEIILTEYAKIRTETRPELPRIVVQRRMGNLTFLLVSEQGITFRTVF